MQRGLMWRKSLPAGTGMLFDLTGEGNEQMNLFWMRNTLVPLDMIFIHTNGCIAGFVQNAKPMKQHYLGIGVRTRAVLEVPAGTVKWDHLRVGDAVRNWIFSDLEFPCRWQTQKVKN